MDTQFSREKEQEMLAEILENTRKTRQFMKWQLIITIAFVVLPLFAVGIVLPMVLKSLVGAYDIGGLQ